MMQNNDRAELPQVYVYGEGIYSSSSSKGWTWSRSRVVVSSSLRLLLFVGTNFGGFKVPWVWWVLILGIFAVYIHG